MILLLLAALASILSLRTLWPEEEKTPLEICLIGSAEHPKAVATVYEQWGGQFPAVYYIWNTSVTDSELELYNPDKDRIRLIHTPAISLTFTDGLDLARQEVLSAFQCQYIFVHDDDLVFKVRKHKSSHSRKLTEPMILAAELQSVLQRYKPGIAGFPWPVGDVDRNSMTEMRDAWLDTDIAPLTGFDNGMVLFHRDSVDFFFVCFPILSWSLTTDRLPSAVSTCRRRRFCGQVDTECAFPNG